MEQLTGSERQIAYANVIRDRFLEEIAQLVPQRIASQVHADLYAARADALIGIATESKWWIEHRGIINDVRRTLRTRPERTGACNVGEGDWTAELAMRECN